MRRTGPSWKGRNQIAVRLARLIYLATSRRYVMPTREALARELGVCRRTLQRDLIACSLAGVPIRGYREQFDEVEP